ncbi:hypothetical protein ORJ00_11335 [Rheinheimera baltica]|uniref:DUF6911 family protein n=1 Tax=Rheinheimera baltica TaxID=67576 RepID=UPI00273D03D5|nr:hypothetical protein [Rheinheimera baltica]MDP5143339.1 hypothetical protein [Rheinheimera baltica]
MSIILGGYIMGVDFERQQLPTISDPNYRAIEDTLLSLKGVDSVVVLRAVPEPEVGPYELTLHCDKGNYLIMLNEYDDDGDSGVRAISNTSSDSTLIPILGDLYSAKLITRDFQVVCSIFKEFADTGNVPELLMS